MIFKEENKRGETISGLIFYLGRGLIKKVTPPEEVPTGSGFLPNSQAAELTCLQRHTPSPCDQGSEYYQNDPGPHDHH